MEGLEMENIDKALHTSPKILNTVGRMIAKEAKRNRRIKNGNITMG
jgi:hypothetical protein